MVGVWGLAGVAADDLWAVGNRYDVDLGRDAPWVAHWDGAGWSEIEVPASPGSYPSQRLWTAAVVGGSAWLVGGSSQTPVPDAPTRPLLFAGSCS